MSELSLFVVVVVGGGAPRAFIVVPRPRDVGEYPSKPTNRGAASLQE